MGTVIRRRFRVVWLVVVAASSLVLLTGAHPATAFPLILIPIIIGSLGALAKGVCGSDGCLKPR